MLNEISREIASILDPDELLSAWASWCDASSTTRCSPSGWSTIGIRCWRTPRSPLPQPPLPPLGPARLCCLDHPLPLQRGLVGAAIREEAVIHVSDVRKDSRYHMVNPETRSEMTVPLIYKGTAIGVLDVEHTRLHYFTEDHERAMTTLAAQIAIALENARLYTRVTQQEQRLERDLAMARKVQLRLLPPAKPQHKRAEFAARFLPARTIGGDLYDFLQYDPSRSAIALGDVSGKAAPAALYAALVSGIMRSVASQHLSPSEMLRTLNDALQERKLDSQYVTMLYGVWNDENLTIQIANGGSVQPLFCRGEEIETIRAEGFPLGMFPNATWEEFSISTQPGDSLVFFSDGIVDAQNSAGDMFGNDRLLATVKKHQHKSASSGREHPDGCGPLPGQEGPLRRRNRRRAPRDLAASRSVHELFACAMFWPRLYR